MARRVCHSGCRYHLAAGIGSPVKLCCAIAVSRRRMFGDLGHFPFEAFDAALATLVSALHIATARAGLERSGTAKHR